MSSTEFFTLVRAHLTDNGVMVVNMNMHSDGEGSINEYLTDTIASVFPHVYTADVSRNTNRELFAAAFDPSAALTENLPTVTDAPLAAMLEQVSASLTPRVPGGKILTDDRAPVELLGMRAIDELITDELGYYKDLFRREGVRGLLNSF